jgi:hypothetical protein
MGVVVIAVYRPRPGGEAELLNLVRGHLALLREEGLVTERERVVMRAADGSILEVFEWASPEAIDRAHGNPRVAALWERFGAVCEYGSLGSLPEAGQPFPGFTPLALD